MDGMKNNGSSTLTMKIMGLIHFLVNSLMFLSSKWEIINVSIINIIEIIEIYPKIDMRLLTSDKCLLVFILMYIETSKTRSNVITKGYRINPFIMIE